MMSCINVWSRIYRIKESRYLFFPFHYHIISLNQTIIMPNMHAYHVHVLVSSVAPGFAFPSPWFPSC